MPDIVGTDNHRRVHDRGADTVCGVSDCVGMVMKYQAKPADSANRIMKW
jgi:hypothetical protein